MEDLRPGRVRVVAVARLADINNVEIDGRGKRGKSRSEERNRQEQKRERRRYAWNRLTRPLAALASDRDEGKRSGICESPPIRPKV